MGGCFVPRGGLLEDGRWWKGALKAFEGSRVGVELSLWGHREAETAEATATGTRHD